LTDNPAARQMLDYLFVRGGVHAHVYALALEQLTGVEMQKILAIPKIENVLLPGSKTFRGEGLPPQAVPVRPDDYKDVRAIWQGQALDGSGPLEVVDGPPEGGDLARLDGAGDAFTPEYHPEEIFEMAQRLYQRARLPHVSFVLPGPEASPPGLST
jgi:Mn-containing catalase